MMGVAICASTRCRATRASSCSNWAFELPWVGSAIRKVGGVRRLALQRDAPARAGPAGRASSPRASRAPARTSRTATGCSASAAAGSSRSRCARGAPIIPVRGRRQRGDLPEGRRGALAGASDRRAVLPDHADVPAARAARRGAAAVASGGSSSATPIDRARTAPTPPRTAARVRALGARPRADPGQRCTRTSSSAKRGVPLDVRNGAAESRTVPRGHGPDVRADEHGPGDGAEAARRATCRSDSTSPTWTWW